MSLLDLAHQQISAADIQRMSAEIGADPASTQKAVQAAVPMMIGGMAGAAQQPDGESAIQSAIGALGGGGMGGVLGSILGQHHATVQDGVQKASGLNTQSAGKLLVLLAPFVLRALAKHQESAPAQQGGIAGSLQKEAQAAQAAAPPEAGGILGKILGAM
jgi:hypothetical protein